MGAWGFGVREDDFVLDVIGAFEDFLKAGKNMREATDALQSRFVAALSDEDDGSLFWLAVADVQWTYGSLDSHVRDQVRQDLESGRSLAAWSESEHGLSRRRAALEKFLGKIEQRNPRPKKLPKLVVRAPRFSPGDCLSICLSSGQYAAALVLAADHSHMENGRNLIGILDYLAADKPSISVFRERNWLVLQHPGARPLDIAWYFATGYRGMKDRLEVVGTIEILDSDATDSNFYRPWKGIGERVITRTG